MNHIQPALCKTVTNTGSLVFEPLALTQQNRRLAILLNSMWQSSEAMHIGAGTADVDMICVYRLYDPSSTGFVHW